MTDREVSTSQFGKFIYLDFWATWCGPCIKEFPRLKKLSEQYNKDKFEIIGIVGASKSDAIKKVIEKRGVNWRQIHSDKIVDKYQIREYPTTFLISPDGKIIGKNIRGEELEKRLAELIQ
ncbi:TlpA family protein disulfide reductase [Catalinimonas niigatensis]|uniref:TlpA family protein disulfide reductase n=1 Tax=Catalinimonas niigatensis TaxID=1397264 RepID=UPI003898FE60